MQDAPAAQPSVPKSRKKKTAEVPAGVINALAENPSLNHQ
jgi:hypothetical protein